MKHSTARSKGYTLAGLLVVIAILGIFYGLLPSAVQAVGEAARQAVSCSRSRGIGISIYHEIYEFDEFDTDPEFPEFAFDTQFTDGDFGGTSVNGSTICIPDGYYGYPEKELQ